MGRANLGQLLGNVDEPAQGPLVTEPGRATPTGGEAPKRKPVPLAAPRRDEPPAPSYLRFVRKDTRLREDQLEALTSHARRLTRARRLAGGRITENTLIRIAVDLLLDRIERASGHDEPALLRSVRR